MSLNKELCKNCPLKQKESKWNKKDEKYWKNGWVKCPLTCDATDEEAFRIDSKYCSFKMSGVDIMSIPLYHCPYYLEHSLTSQ